MGKKKPWDGNTGGSNITNYLMFQLMKSCIERFIVNLLYLASLILRWGDSSWRDTTFPTMQICYRHGMLGPDIDWFLSVWCVRTQNTVQSQRSIERENKVYFNLNVGSTVLYHKHSMPKCMDYCSGKYAPVLYCTQKGVMFFMYSCLLHHNITVILIAKFAWRINRWLVFCP